MDKVSFETMQGSSYRELLNQQTKKRKKTTMGRLPYRGLLVVVFCMLALPLILSFFFREDTISGRDEGIVRTESADSGYFVTCSRASGEISVPMEEYLISTLARTMDAEEPEEALMAMAVLLRTQVVYESEKTGSCRVENLKTVEELKQEWGQEGETRLGIYQRAVLKTEGIIMTYQGEAMETAYHLISAGSTREGNAVFGDRLPYLKAVECEDDLMASGYRTVITMTQKEFFETVRKLTGSEELTEAEIMIEERDEAGYILSLTVQGEGFDSIRVGGETFRSFFELPSSNFTVEQTENEVIFVCRGAGHGFGMSLYQACRLAEDGMEFMDILRYFFDGIVFMRIA